MNENAEAANPEPGSRFIQTTAEEREQWARRFSESGLSLRKFSAQHGLHWYSLWRWVDRRRQVAQRENVSELSSETIEFAEIKLLACLESANWVAEVGLPGGRVLRFSREVPASMLEQLLRLC